MTLGTSCTLREAVQLQAQLVDASGRNGVVVVAGGAVERIDTAGMQLLVAFARREAAAGRRLQWQSASFELLDAGARLGLADALGLAGAAGAAR